MGENSDLFSTTVGLKEQEALFADEQPFDLLCKRQKTPLKNPVYFHNHGELVFEKSSQTFKEDVLDPFELHFRKTGECYISGMLGSDQSLCQGDRSNLQHFCTTKKHTKLCQLIEKRVLDASHQEIVAFPSSKQQQYVFTSFAEQGATNLFYTIQNLQRERNFNQDSIIKFLLQQQENTLINNDSKYQQLISKLAQQKKPFFNICPISGNPIRIAVRMKRCDHEECFDLESILNFYNTTKFQGPISCPYPKCKNRFDFLTQTDQFYLDFEYQKWIMSNLQYMPMWSPIPESSSFQDVYFLMHYTLTQYSNSIYWFTLKKNGLEIQEEYENQQKKYTSGNFNQVKFEGNYQGLPIPVRCINCTDYSRFCDLSDQMRNASQCLLCGHQLFSEYDLVFDIILMEQIIKFCQLDIKEFIILSKNPLSLFPNLDLIAQKLPSQNLSNEFIIKTVAFNTGQTIQGLPIKWKNCQHSEFYDIINELPRFCTMCKKHYLVEDILYFPQVRKCIQEGFTFPQVTFRNGQYINSQHDSSILHDSVKNKTPSFINNFTNNNAAFGNMSTALPNQNNPQQGFQSKTINYSQLINQARPINQQQGTTSNQNIWQKQEQQITNQSSSISNQPQPAQPQNVTQNFSSWSNPQPKKYSTQKQMSEQGWGMQPINDQNVTQIYSQEPQQSFIQQQQGQQWQQKSQNLQQQPQQQPTFNQQSQPNQNLQQQPYQNQQQQPIYAQPQVIVPQVPLIQVIRSPFAPQYEIDLYQKFIPFKAANIQGVLVNQREESRPAPVQPPPQIQHNQQNSQRPQTGNPTVREVGGKKAIFRMIQ